MNLVDGVWDCSVRSPVGDVPFIVTLRSEGSRFTGDIEGNLGTDNHCSGEIDGNRLNWSMPIAKPFPLTLKCSVVIDGQEFTGSASASVFGKFPLRGTRREAAPVEG